MNKFLLILVLTLSFQSLSKADDIKEFEIEGMSIGESLLNHMSLDEIRLSKQNYFGENKRYYVVGKYNDLNVYNAVDIYLKTNDNKFIIKTLSGMIGMDKNKCLKERKVIVNELKEIFYNIKEKNFENVEHSFDKTGNSKVYQTAFLFKNSNDGDHIRVECTDWSKKIENEKGWSDNLSVAAFSEAILLWFRDGYN